ncbi:MAG: DoxX family protein [Caulobacteraceae bacterium]
MIRTADLDAWAPRVLSILRIVAALMFMQHGLMKLWGFPAVIPGAPDQLPPLMLIGAWMEVVGGGLLALGLFTRPVAFLLSGQMAVAYWMFHFKPDSIWPAVNQGELAIMYCFVFLYFVFAGGGAWSVDAWFNRRRPLTATVH